MHDYWKRQTKEAPLYPDLLWSQPEQASQAGKLLVVGGNAHGFAAPAEAYNEATAAGIGVSRVLLPDSLQKTVGRILTNGEYAPSTPSGSFAKTALASLLEMSYWADATLLAGDFGRNSETAILLERFMAKYDGILTLTKDTIDYMSTAPIALLGRPKTLLVLSFAQLQKLTIAVKFIPGLTFDMDFVRLVEALHLLTRQYNIALLVKRNDTIFVAVDGMVSTTKLEVDVAVWRVKTAARATVWWLQNSQKPFDALTSSLVTQTKE